MRVHLTQCLRFIDTEPVANDGLVQDKHYSSPGNSTRFGRASVKFDRSLHIDTFGQCRFFHH